MGVRGFSPETVLNGMAWDLQRFARERQSREVVIKRTESFLKIIKSQNKWNRVLWWETPAGHVKTLNINQELALIHEEKEMIKTNEVDD